MKKSKFSELQIAYAIRPAERGTAVANVCRQLGVSEATFCVWEKKSARLTERLAAESARSASRN